jgi:plasmid maintenance system antidote protein VapI
MTIIDQLRKAIETSDESVYAIAKATGVPQSVLSRFVRGERGITFETAAKLAAYLKLRLR